MGSVLGDANDHAEDQSLRVNDFRRLSTLWIIPKLQNARSAAEGMIRSYDCATVDPELHELRRFAVAATPEKSGPAHSSGAS